MVDAAIKKRKEDQFFNKEFAKDVKKLLNKTVIEEKADIFDQFADGDLSVDEFLDQMEKKNLNKRKSQTHKKVNQTAVFGSRSKQTINNFFTASLP